MNRTVIGSEIPRIFGDSELAVYIDDGSVKVDYRSLKSLRFFELLVKGKKYYEVPHIMARICGACSQAHFWASVLAIELALDIDVSEDTAKLRDACNKIGLIQNHVIHLAFMALPDYLNDTSELAKLAITLTSRLNRALELIGGRLINPNIYKPGGFTDAVTCHKVRKALEVLKTTRSDLSRFTNFVLQVKIPQLDDPSPNYLTLSRAPKETVPNDKKYTIVTQSGTLLELKDYREVFKEVEVDNSTSRKCLYRGQVFYVGARARILNLVRNLKVDPFHGALPEILRLLESNPFANIYAKAVESNIILDELIDDLEELSLRRLRLVNQSSIKLNKGVGLGIVEAPRGLLVHYYRLDNELQVVETDVITPTVMNTLHIEKSSESLVGHLLESGITDVDTIRRYVESLIRAYDPCIVCAVHVIRRR